MTDPNSTQDDDPVREDHVEDRPPWAEDFANSFHPRWEPKFEEEAPAPEPEPPPRKERPVKDMGVRAVARSADGLTVLNTIEVLPPFDFSV